MPTIRRIAGRQKISRQVISLFIVISFSCLFRVRAPPYPPFIALLKPPKPAEQSAPLDCILEGALRTSKYH